jgi:hypothetical protein
VFLENGNGKDDRIFEILRGISFTEENKVDLERLNCCNDFSKI